MTRQIIPIDKVVKCHVNSVDSSPTYESGVSYAAGTLVNYNDDSFTAIVDIEDSDTDTPLEAPEKWAFTPNAFRTSGNSGLTDRVEALEAFDEAIPDGYICIGKISFFLAADETKTFGENLDALAAGFVDMLATLEDDEMVMPITLNIRNYAEIILKQDSFSNVDAAISIMGIGSGVGASSCTLHQVNLSSISGDSVYDTVAFNSGGATFANKTGDLQLLDTSGNNNISYIKYKKIK